MLIKNDPVVKFYWKNCSKWNEKYDAKLSILRSIAKTIEVYIRLKGYLLTEKQFLKNLSLLLFNTYKIKK